MRETSRKNLSDEFQDHYLSSSKTGMRIGFFLLLILMAVLVLFNSMFFPEAKESSFFYRFWIITPLLIISIIVTYIPGLRKWLPTVFISLNICMAAAIFWIGITATPLDVGYESYYTLVSLVVIVFFAFFRLPPMITGLIAALQFSAYVLATLMNGSFQHNHFNYFRKLFFIVAIYCIGFLMVLMFRKLNWKNFLHEKALSENYKTLLREIEERKQAEKLLKQSELLYNSTINSIPDWIYVLDKDLRFVMLNASLQEEHYRQGFPLNCIGKKITKIYPYMPASTIEEINRVFSTGEILVGEQNFFLRDKTIYGETRKVPIFKDQEVVQVMTIMRNRSREREIEELKQRNIEQKEVMLREIHHRVKNNLSIVISLLNLQIRNNPDPQLVRIIHDIEMRIRSMALIHEHLYRSESIDKIPLASYLHSLSTIISGTFSGHRINLVTQFDQVDVSIETALPLGLIANELIINAFKYAYPFQEKGDIQVSLKQDQENMWAMVIKDNGVGLPDSFTMDSEKSLGMFIVRLLVEQIDGKIDIIRHSGTTFIIRFRENISKNHIIEK